METESIAWRMPTLPNLLDCQLLQRWLYVTVITHELLTFSIAISFPQNVAHLYTASGESMALYLCLVHSGAAYESAHLPAGNFWK